MLRDLARALRLVEEVIASSGPESRIRETTDRAAASGPVLYPFSLQSFHGINQSSYIFNDISQLRITQSRHYQQSKAPLQEALASVYDSTI